MPLDTLNPRSQIIGDYGIVEKIADGGMGTVYKARHLLTGDIVAIKVVPPQLAKNQIMCKRLEQEYNVARNLDHPNIVRAIDFGYSGPSPFLVMEFVDGESLGQRIERDGKIPEAEAIRLIAEVAKGLHKAHQKGMIHRDVKPDNILVTLEGQAKLTDLGLVKEMETDLNLTRTGRGLGTPHFMAPEQFRNAKKADVRCDIYSLAATLYMMVTGELPFKSCGPLDAWMKKINNDLPTPRSLVPHLSERLDWTIRRAMSPDATQRPATCREFLEDLTGHTTQKLHDDDEETGDTWYLYYRERDGVVFTLKGKLTSLRKSIKDGKWRDLDQIRVARTKAGPFEPMRNLAEFRDLVVDLDSLSNTALTQGPATIPLAEAKKETAAVVSPSTPTPRPPTKPAPVPKAVAKVPDISVREPEDNGDSFKWAVLFMLAFIAGVGGFFLVPFLRHWGIL